MSEAKEIQRNDGYRNAFVQNGIRQYTENNSFIEQELSFNMLNTLWHNPLVRKIAKLPAQAAMKKGFTIIGDEENDDILQALDVLHARSKIQAALMWARYYGRACIFMLLDDGGLEDEPVNWDRLKRIKDLYVFDAQAIQEDQGTWLLNDDINDPNFGKPEWYMITPQTSGKLLYVHHSRLLIFNGEQVTETERLARNGVGLSCLEGAIKSLMRLEKSESAAVNVLERISTSLMKFAGLSEILSTEGGDAMVQKRLELIDLARNVLNSIAIDTTDEYEVFNIPVGGIDSLIQQFAQHLCASVNIPYSVLFGRLNGGLTSSAESDLETYYSYVAGIQQDILSAPLEQLVKTIQLCQEGPTKGKELENWTIEFNPLWEDTDKEKAETEKLRKDSARTMVDTVMTLVDRQLMDASQARQYLAEQLDLPITDTLNLGDFDDLDEE